MITCSKKKKNPPCNAGDTGSIPDQGTKIPHATEQLLSPLSEARESVHHIEKGPHDAMTFPSAATKNQGSPITN